MFNSEIKKRFVNDYTSSVSTAAVCEAIFNNFEPYETEWGADLCTRPESDLQPIIDTLVGFRARSRFQKTIILKDYVRWCINVAKVPGACDGMLKINSVGLDTVRKHTVSSPLHLQKYLNSLYNPESELTSDNICRCFFWLAYGGVPEEDILSVKCSEVDFVNMVIHHNGTQYPIYREAVPAFRNCVELTQFVLPNPIYHETTWKDRVAGDTLVRGIKPITSIYSLRVSISRSSKKHEDKTQMRLSYFRVWISGIFYRAYENEMIEKEPNFETIVLQQMMGKTYMLDSGRNTIEAKKRQLIRDYQEDYQRWKLAYRI